MIQKAASGRQEYWKSNPAKHQFIAPLSLTGLQSARLGVTKRCQAGSIRG
jgi:hypothetical protein